MPSCTHLPRRPVCPRCQRPAAACICAAVRPVAHQVQVLILMHPLEQHQAKGTARLLHLCLTGSRIVVGETFGDAALAQEINAPWVDGDRQAPRRAVLLYPPTPPDPQHPMLPAPPLSTDWLAAPERLRLVVLDGTWRKSRRMLWANPALQALPRLALQQVPPRAMPCARRTRRTSSARWRPRSAHCSNWNPPTRTSPHWVRPWTH